MIESVLASQADPRRVLFVDDQARNVLAARGLGLRAMQLTADPRSALRVDRALAGTCATIPEDPIYPSGART